MKKITSTQIILLGFLGAVLGGSFLLTLPVSSSAGTWTSFPDALFTATTSVCVTGLTVVDTYSHWSLFGQILILILIQLGGLGVISFSTAFIYLLRRKVSLEGRILLESAFNLDSLEGVTKFLKKVFFGTVVVEGVGAILCLPVFVPRYGLRGIWISVFHSISAFCNAGIDIIGPNSLMDYSNDVWLNLVTMLLIILGGIGFIVWWDVLDVHRRRRRREIKTHHYLNFLSLHTKITLITTIALIIGGAVFFTAVEWTNPATIGNYSIGHKILCGAFQSVTLRTAGFASIPQSGLTDASVIVSVILMFIGGSSVGTAGGIKTSTIALVILSALTVIKGGECVTAHGRTIPHRLVQRSLAITAIAATTLVVATILLSMFQKAPLADVVYEAASALGTAGLSRGICAKLTLPSQILITICMYLGRVGPISLAMAFAYRSSADRIQYPERDITIG